jgi:hypothetical protein
MSKSRHLIKFFLQELESLIERLDKSSRESQSSGSQPATKVEHQSEQQSAQVPEPSAETAEAFKNAPVDAPGVQPAPIGEMSPLTVDGANVTTDPDSAASAQETPTEEDSNMLIKSTDGVGPDIETSDAPNPGIAAEKNDGKPVDQSSQVDTNKINLPTPIGSQAALSVNGPVQDGSPDAEQKPEGDSSPMEQEQPEPKTEHQDLRPEDVPSAEPLPVDENATPKANTKVTSTFDPIELKADSPVLSPLQPETGDASLPTLDVAVAEESSEASESEEAPESEEAELSAKVEPTEETDAKKSDSPSEASEQSGASPDAPLADSMSIQTEAPETDSQNGSADKE